MTFSSEAYLTQLAFWKIIGAVEVGFEIEPFIAKFKEGHEFRDGMPNALRRPCLALCRGNIDGWGNPVL
jgi:hypothetical protein